MLPLYKKLIQAYEDGEYDKARELMAGYSKGKVRAAYRAIEIVEGHESYCAVKRGDYSLMGSWLGII